MCAVEVAAPARPLRPSAPTKIVAPIIVDSLRIFILFTYLIVLISELN